MSRAGLTNGAPYLLSLRLLRWPTVRRQTLLSRVQMNFDEFRYCRPIEIRPGKSRVFWAFS